MVNMETINLANIKPSIEVVVSTNGLTMSLVLNT